MTASVSAHRHRRTPRLTPAPPKLNGPARIREGEAPAQPDGDAARPEARPPRFVQADRDSTGSPPVPSRPAVCPPAPPIGNRRPDRAVARQDPSPPNFMGGASRPEVNLPRNQGARPVSPRHVPTGHARAGSRFLNKLKDSNFAIFFLHRAGGAH